jgi:hypothetical protein
MRPSTALTLFGVDPAVPCPFPHSESRLANEPREFVNSIIFFDRLALDQDGEQCLNSSEPIIQVLLDHYSYLQ